jgi:hypothetical protein
MVERKYSFKILALGTKLRWAVSFAGLPLYSRRKSFRYVLYRRLLRNRSGRCGAENSLCPCRESNPNCPPLFSHYTDWVMRLQTIETILLKALIENHIDSLTQLPLNTAYTSTSWQLSPFQRSTYFVHPSISLCICVCIPTIVTRQWLGKHVPAPTNKRNNRTTVWNAVFCAVRVIWKERRRSVRLRTSYFKILFSQNVLNGNSLKTQ